MGLRIVYGKAGTGKSEFCFSEVSRLLNSEEKIFIITPEQFSFTAEKKLLNETKNNAVINAEVLTLSRMSYRVMQEVGNASVSNLSSMENNNELHKLTKAGKAMLVNYIIEQNKDKLKFLGKSNENVNLVIQAITEFKKHKITTDFIKEHIDELQDDYLKIKLNDINLIYECFENNISNRFLDNSDDLNFLENNIEKTDLVKNAVIYIDEFMGFTKQEYGVIAKLIKLAKQVTITLCIDSLKPSASPIGDIYYSNKETLSKLLRLIEENNLKLEEPVEMKENYRLKNTELKILENNIFNNTSTIYEKDVENISLFLAKNQYSEVENVASNILDLIKHKNYRYNEIAVITKNIGTYSNLVRAIFEKYEIPVFIDEKRDLNQNVIIKYILSLLDVISKNYSYESVINYVKSGFCDIDNNQIFKLENYCAKWGIKYNKWKKDFNFEKADKPNEIEDLNEIRKSIINPLEDLKNNIKGRKNPKEICENIYNFIISQNIEEKINKKQQELEDSGFIDLSKEYKKSYEIIINLLDDICEIFENEEFTIEKFLECFKIGLQNSSLGKIPGTQDQVIFGDIERSRNNNIRAIFIIGVNDGIFPSNNRDEGFFNDSDRELFKENNMEIAKGSIENLFEENFNIYKAFSTAEEKVFISYSSADGSGETLRPSMLIIKLKKIFPKLKEQSDVITKRYSIANKKVTYEELLENIYKLKEEEKVEEVWFLVYKYFKKLNETVLNRDLEGLNYSNLPTDISIATIDKLYGNNMVTSVSKLEKYSNCPFSYFLQYGLKLKEKEELKVNNFETGTFMHDVLDRFFEYVKQEGIGLAEFVEDDSKIIEIVSKLVEEELELSKNIKFTVSNKFRFLVNRLKKLVSRALKYIIEGIVYSSFKVEGTELEFGKNESLKPIVLNLDNGKRVELTGKIDRLDTAKTEDGRFLRIIDYKSSFRNIDLNKVYAGLQIQLLTYLDAVSKQENLTPAGILYFNLLEQMVQSDTVLDEEEFENEVRKIFKMNGLIVADVKIIKLHDNTIKDGEASNIVPAALSKSGDINKRSTSAISGEDFKVLQEYIYKTITKISKEIFSGKIDIFPYKKGGRTGCDYCSYKGICGFNTKNCNNKFNYIPNKKADDIIFKMKEEL